jgi:X-Pro dipeptidyl-peptidase (S15 family)
MKKLLIAAAALMAVPGAAEAAAPNPFGHACTPQNGVLFCPTASDAERVPSFDGVPMDVDVTLPASGDGPFPTIVLMHGWGGNKRSFEATAPEGNGGMSYHYNNVYFAQQGYAVVTPSARGFGRSCGAADSRTSPGCSQSKPAVDRALQDQGARFFASQGQQTLVARGGVPPDRQPEGQDRLPALRQRLAIRQGPPGQARAARERPELRAPEQLRLHGAGLEDRRRAAGPLTGTETGLRELADGLWVTGSRSAFSDSRSAATWLSSGSAAASS